MTIELDKIDELRRRANVSYEDAREALIKCDGDIVEALVYLEKNNKIKEVHGDGQKKFSFKSIKALLKKGNDNRFVVRKRDRTVLDLSANVMILITIFAFYVTIAGLIIALIMGYRFKFVNSSGENMKVNQTLEKVHDNIDNLKRKICDEVEGEVQKAN